MLATLARVTGSLPAAEDAVQEAVLVAMQTWPRDGVPASPRAWLTLTARRKAIDVLRREGLRAGKEARATELLEMTLNDPFPESVVRDDRLRLLFTCCHPSLERSTQAALCLRWLCGLSTAEVARALLVSEPAMAKRLTRARRKITDAHIPYRVPTDADLPDRVSGVLRAVYLLFNEGYSTTDRDTPVRTELVDEAIRLARGLRELLPDDAGVVGLLALLLLQSSRDSARIDAAGSAVLLQDQDRSSWRQDRIQEGVSLVGVGLSRTPTTPDRYVVQAAIAACHAVAASWQDTDWSAIASWYDLLYELDPSPVVALNRAVAVGELHGPQAGLDLLDGDAMSALVAYPLLAASRAELLTRLDRPREAADALHRALALPLNGAQRLLLEQRLASLDRRSDPTSTP